MSLEKLRAYIELAPGLNLSRYDESDKVEGYTLYDQAMFERDLYNIDRHEEYVDLYKGEPYLLNEGDVVISVSSQLATIVGKSDSILVLPNNFIKVVFKTSELDREYFVYLFNASQGLKRQKSREAQGIKEHIQRLTQKGILDLLVPILPLTEQVKIGKVYVESLKLQMLIERKKSLLGKLVEQVLEDCSGGGLNE